MREVQVKHAMVQMDLLNIESVNKSPRQDCVSFGDWREHNSPYCELCVCLTVWTVHDESRFNPQVYSPNLIPLYNTMVCFKSQIAFV